MKYDVRGGAVVNNALLGIQWSDGDMFNGAGNKHSIFSDDDKKSIRFNKHKWLKGEAVVSYKDRIIYITNNGLKTNHTIALDIKNAITTGYTEDIALLEE